MSLGTQVAFFTALCVLNNLSITSLVRSVALMSAARPNLSLGTQGYLPQSAQPESWNPSLSRRRRAARPSSTSSPSSLTPQAAMEVNMTPARDAAAIRPSPMPVATQLNSTPMNCGMELAVEEAFALYNARVAGDYTSNDRLRGMVHGPLVPGTGECWPRHRSISSDGQAAAR